MDTPVSDLILLPEPESDLENAEQDLGFDSDEDSYLHETHAALEEENLQTTVRNSQPISYHFFIS